MLRQVSATPEPVDLWCGISPDHICLIILKVPWNNDNNVVFTNPYPFLHSSGYPGSPHSSIDASNPQMVCAKQFLHCCQNLAVMLARGAYASYRCFWLLLFTQIQHLDI